MNTSHNGYAPGPGPACANFISHLPLLGTGGLTPVETSALEAHLRDCAACRAQRVAFDLVEVAVRRQYGVTPGAPAITFDDMLRRAEHNEAGPATPLPPLLPARRRFALMPDDSIGHASAPASPAMRAPESLSHERRGRRRVPSYAALAAALLIVALFGAVFAHLGASHSAVGGLTGPAVPPTPTNGAPAHYLGAQAHWDQVAQFPTDGSTHYAVSPADPRLVYRANGARLDVSSDDGVTWKRLTIPSPDPKQSAFVSITPSPTNARVVTLGMNCAFEATDVQAQTPVPTAAPGASPAADNYLCSTFFVSADDGEQWQPLKLPGGGHLEYIGGAGHPFLQQGNRLYAAAGNDTLMEAIHDSELRPVDGYRLLTSVDGGVTWTTADDALVAQHEPVLETVATPSGSTLFALTGRSSVIRSGDAPGPRPHTLWRSDDAGQSWTRLNTFADGQTRGYAGLIAATLGADGAATLYYLNTMMGGNPQPSLHAPPDQVYATRDDGHTWTHSPGAGIPSGSVALNIVGTLGDGSLALGFGHITTSASAGAASSFIFGDTTYDAWKPGADRWTQLTPSAPVPSTGVESVQWLWITPAHGATPETLWSVPDTGAATKILRCALS